MKNKMSLINKLTGLLFCLFIFSCNPSKEKHDDQPNIIFIFADDMTYSAINALGNKEIITPNLNWLVENGTTFTHTYNMGAWNGAVCMASRAMIISGQSVWNAKAITDDWEQNKALKQTWGALMDKAGYDTYMTGKWHVAAPANQVFKNVIHVRPGMPGDAWEHHTMVANFKSIEGTSEDPSKFIPVGYNRPLSENDTTWSPTDHKFGGYWEGGKHWSEVLKNDALKFLDKAETSENPFFMYLAFNAPHDPRQAPQEYLDRYPVDSISLPKSWLEEYPFNKGMGSGRDMRDEALAPFPRTAYATKKNIQEYYALITHLDHQIGLILEKLKASGKMENTYLFFTADHGLAMGRHGLFGKQNLFDHSIRAPFIISGPDVPKNKKIDLDIYLQDIMPTSLNLAGIEKPDYVFFNDLLPLVKGNQLKSTYNAIYGAYVDTQRMIRKDGFKLLVYPKIDTVLLFDLKEDPEEMNNLSEDPVYREKTITLFKDLISLQEEMHDNLSLSATYENYIGQ
ncbi:sulfatase-like hydrolase/transferase [Croceitalea marina]|uniref:Sulfatase-like hydrolase/transferase n=1 Tax=Croceitalea marina TaxID=1775166 RepID=A0ABW5MY86_9FLAO